jgi:peptidoglycan/LPS O-acetylase OafA/YrhL
LSGFILTYTYFGKGPMLGSRREFYVGRFSRIYPVYALGLAMMAPFFVVAHLRHGDYGALGLEGAAVVLLQQAHVPSLAMAWNPPAWSLSAEAFFYAVFPFVAPAIVRLRVRRALLLASSCWVASMGVAAAYLAIRPDGISAPTSESVAFWLDLAKYSPLARIFEFLLGIALGRVFLDDAARAVVARHARGLSLSATAVALVCVAQSERVPYLLLHNGLLAPVFAVLVLSLSCGVGPVAKGLAAHPFVRLGEASYALYILHIPLFILTRKVAEWLTGGSSAVTAQPLFTLAFVAAALAASLLCFALVEVPLRSRVRAVLLPSVRDTAKRIA